MISPPTTTERVDAARSGRDWLRLPPEGAIGIVAVLGMLAVVGVAVDHAGWAGVVPGRRISQTAFLPLAIVVAGIVGMLLGRARIGALKAHVIGAGVGALFLLNATAAIFVQATTLEERLHWLNWSVNKWAWESIVVGIRSSETSAFLLMLGALLWGVGQLGAFNVFRRRRAVPLITLGAVALLLNMGLTTQDQFIHLVLFSAGALLLLIRINLLTEIDGWRSRRLLDVGQAGELFLSRGAAFIGVALVSSIALAGSASSAPLSRTWRDVDSSLLELGYSVNRWLGGVSGPVRGSANLFGPTQTLRDVWESSSEPIFTARVGDEGAYYWRGATYDSFDGRTWQQLDPMITVIPASEDILAGSAESLSEAVSRRQLAFTVSSIGIGGNVIVVPESPLVVDRATERRAHFGEGGFISLHLADGLRDGTTYSGISLVPQDRGPEQITANRLAAAGTDYEPWVSRYLEIRPGSIGERTYLEAAGVVAELPPDKLNPFHIAEAIEAWLWSEGGFSYSTDLSGLCVGENLIDCFLETKIGYCERFASAMVMMLRSQGVPSRYVVGYLPGTPLGEDAWQVERSAAHAWVEVFFPGYGWYRFDPTPGNSDNGQTPTTLPDGQPVDGPPGTFLPPVGPDRLPDEIDELPPVIGPIVPPPNIGAGTGSPLGGLLLVLLALAALSGGLLMMARLRRRGPIGATRAYDGLTQLAGRLGHRPRPNQTVYEYTGGLAQLVPAVAADLELIATAKVEATYSQRAQVGFATQLAYAYRRARIGLLRLLMRRPRWANKPRELRRRR